MQQGVFVMPSVSGSASSGSYVKLQDGTMIQWGYKSIEITSGNAYADAVITYPTEFHSSTGSPLVTVSNAASGTGASSQSNVCIPMAINLNTASKLSAFTLRIWKQASVGTANNPEPLISWVAIGRWKE